MTPTWNAYRAAKARAEEEKRAMGNEECLRQVWGILRRPDHAEEFTMEDLDKSWGEMRILVGKQMAQWRNALAENGQRGKPA